jgi:hypothetical protein
VTFGNFSDDFTVTSARYSSVTNLGGGADTVTIQCDEQDTNDPWHAFSSGAITQVCHVLTFTGRYLRNCMVAILISIVGKFAGSENMAWFCTHYLLIAMAQKLISNRIDFQNLRLNQIHEKSRANKQSMFLWAGSIDCCAFYRLSAQAPTAR